MKANLLTGLLLVAEVVLAAGAFAYLNVAKSNTNHGTYAVGAKADGTGGVDIDVLAGGALVVLGAAIKSPISAHLVALGAGGLSSFGSRQGATQAMKRQRSGQLMTNAPQTSSGTSSSYYPNYRQLSMPRIVDPYASQFAAAPVYGAPNYAGI